MAHELEIRNGEASMMYVGDAPWHGLGTRLEEPATAAEAIRAARLDWRVVKKPLYAVDERALQLADRFAVVRSDLWGKEDCPILGIVSRNYKPLQNHEAFTSFDDIVGSGKAIYHTAGALGSGERVWILAKLPGQIRVIGDDIVDKYLLLSNSHDGSSSVQIKFTPVRVVCQNTLSLALAGGRTFRVAHTRGMKDRLALMKHTLGIVDRGFEEAGESFRAMAGIEFDRAKLARYLRRVFPDPADRLDESRLARVRRDRLWAEYFFDEGLGNREGRGRGTLWAAYNGVTEYVDHRRLAQSADRRLASVWFGPGNQVKARALKAAVEMMQGWAN